MKNVSLLFFIGFIFFISGCGKTEMNDDDEKRLVHLYNDSYKITDPDKLNAVSGQILQIVSGLKENTVTKACRIHAHTMRGFAACIQKDKAEAVRELEKALKILPEIRGTDFYFKLAAELYSVFALVNFDNPQAEPWFSKLEELIGNEMKGEHYLRASRDYQIMVKIRKYEFLLCRAEYLAMREKDVPQAEKLLLSGIRELENKADEHFIPHLLRCCDLLNEIYYRNRNEKNCRVYAEKCMDIAGKNNLIPMFADENLYHIYMKEEDYPAALVCCRAMLNLPRVQTGNQKLRRKYLLRAATVCEKLNDMKNAEGYRIQAKKIKLSAKKKPDCNP